MKYKLIVLAIILILCSSCSFINESDENSDPIEHPDLTLINSTYNINTSDNSRIVLKSSKIDFYNKTNLTLIDNASFEIVDVNNTLISQGSCNQVKINTNTNDVEFNENVIINIIDPKLDIKCDKISWNNKDNILSTDEKVQVDSEFGKFEGTGFSANISTRYFEFKQIDKGELYEKDN